MDEERPQNEPQLEDEGIPDHEGPLPSKVRSGDQQEGIIPPGTDPKAVDRTGTTAAEQRDGERLSERLEAEVPDDADGFDDAPGEAAEEAAVRVVEDVPGAIDRPGDGYVDEEAS